MTGFFVPNLGNRNPIPHNTDLVTFEHKMPKSCDLRLHARNTERGDLRKRLETESEAKNDI